MLWRVVPVSLERLSRRLHPSDCRQAGREGRAHAGASRRRSLHAPAAGRSGRRQGRVHRRGDRAREAAARQRRLPRGVRPRARRHPRRHPRGPRGVRRPLRRVVQRTQPRRQRCHRPRARPAAQERRRVREGRGTVVPRHGLRRREGPRGGPRERPEDLLRLGHRLSPEQVRARLAAPGRRARLGPPRLRRARARRPGRHGPVRRLPRSAPDAVRHALPRRREGADVHALGRVHHAARTAARGRQRRCALLLRDAQQRPAPRLRHAARDLEVEREPGLLHPVRPCARVQRAAADARKGLRPRCGTRAGQPAATRRAARAGAARHAEPLSGSRRVGRAAARTARAGALPARARDRLPRLLQRAPVPGGGRRAARRARHPHPGRTPGRAQRARPARRLGARGDVT